MLRSEVVLSDDLEVFLDRLTVRVALFSISSQQHPALVARLTDFLEDYGAVGFLFSKYKNGGSIESVSVDFWSSRIEKNGSRFEDIVTTLILATVSSVVAGILVEMWKGEFGIFKEILKLNGDEEERLRIISRKEPHFREDLDNVLPYYYAKIEGKGVSDLSVATALYQFLQRGGTFKDFAQQHVKAINCQSRASFLPYIRDVSRGVIKTELSRPAQYKILGAVTEKTGFPLNPVLAFGEAISLLNVKDLGLGPHPANSLRQQMMAVRLYPDLWPHGVASDFPSPKILIMSDGALHTLRGLGLDDVLHACAGIVSTTSGMTSHIAVMTRALGIGGISCPITASERVPPLMVLFEKDRLILYRDIPNLNHNDFTTLVNFFGRRNLR